MPGNYNGATVSGNVICCCSLPHMSPTPSMILVIRVACLEVSLCMCIDIITLLI